MDRRVLITLAALALLPVRTPAATSAVSATGFTVTVEREIRATRASVYQALGDAGKWWNKDHTWSGDAANLSLEPVAGGCLCERWQGNSVEHGRVLFAAPNRMLRISGALGPLQAFPVVAILTFELADKGTATSLRTTYLVSGGGMDLSTIAAAVDEVIIGQVDRLVGHVNAH